MLTNNTPNVMICESRGIDLTAEEHKSLIEMIACKSIDGLSEAEIEEAVYLAMFRFERMLTSQKKAITEKKVNRFGETDGNWYIQISFF